jgi:hypothetical protein
MIHQVDGAVGSIHSADDAHIFWDLEKSAVYRERNILIPVHQKIHQLSKDAGEIGAVDLIDDQDSEAVSLLGLPAEFKESAGNNFVFQSAIQTGLGPDSLDEVFVSICRVELVLSWFLH